MYDFDHPYDRHNTNSIKWDRQTRAFGCEGLLGAWIADTDFAVEPHIIEAIRQRLEHPVLGYPCPNNSYIPAVINWYKTRHNWQLEPSWIYTTGGLVTALGFAMDCVTEPGDKVMMLTPIYDTFFLLTNHSDRELVTVDMLEKDGGYVADMEAMEREFQNGVKVLIFCNPHNPVGKVWTKEEVTAIAELCARYNVTILSDDVHADIVFSGHTYTPIGSLDCVKDQTITFTGPNKTFSMAGCGLANVICPNMALLNKLRGAMLSKFVMGSNVFSFVATEAAYTYGAQWVDELCAYVEDNWRYVKEYLGREMPKMRVAEQEGTFLAWLDMRCLGLSSKEITSGLVSEEELALNNGCSYGAAGDGFMRLNIGCTRATLEEVMRRLKKFYDAHLK